MPVLAFSDVAVEFGATALLRDVNFSVSAGERWGVVGRNGAGKTTLFRLATGAVEPSRGVVVREPGLRVSLLDQDRDLGGAGTVWEAAAIGYRDLLRLEQRLERDAGRIAGLGDAVTPEDLNAYGHDLERFQHAGGYEFHARVDAVLQGVGFDPEEARLRRLETLSGGERGRVGLAAQLAAPADLVLLDEPTNHLDLATIDWLTRYLGQLGETVLVISHDRAFLDETVDHVLHVAEGTATPYRGGYSGFVRQRAERVLALERQVNEQRRMIAREEDYIRRNIAGGNSAQAKGRRARLARLPRLSAPPADADAMALRLTPAERGGDQVMVIDRLGVQAGERRLVRDFSAVVRRGDIIALVGANGAGKTTLLATLLGERPPESGSVRLGAGVSTAWFRQDLAQVPDHGTLYDSIAELRPAWGRGPVQALLGRFGFTGAAVQRMVPTLSGGERARLALALLTLSRANLLVLDEPTNHLDVESIEALEDALDEYDGSVIVVSHDRAFLRELARRVWALEEGRILDYGGTFAEWEAHAAARDADRAGKAAEASAAKRVSDRAERKDAAAARRAEAEAGRLARREVKALEAEAHQWQERVAGLQSALADPALYAGSPEGAREAGRLNQALRAAREELDQALARWASAAERL